MTPPHNDDGDNGTAGCVEPQSCRTTEECLAMLIEQSASMKVSIDGIKTLLRAIPPRLDTLSSDKTSLASRMDTLCVEMRDLASKVHRANNLMTPFADELQELHQARIHFQRALDVVEARVKLALNELAQARP